MASRVVRSLWITRKSIDSGFHPPELLTAWDEWTIDENPDGWQDECKRCLDAVGSDLSSHRYIDLYIDEHELSAPFKRHAG